MQTPLVSIIIPTYNRAHLIGETLDSIIAQTYVNWECIVVDDGSTDNTNEVLDKYCKKDARFQYHHRPKDRPKGGNACRNYGYEISNGEFINWFDSDDIMKPQLIEEKLSLMDEKMDAVISYGAYFHESILNFEISTPQIKSTILDFIRGDFHLSTPGPLWKSSFLKKEKLFDEKRHKIQDIEFHFRMLLTNFKYKFYEDDFLFFIRRGNDRISSKKSLTSKKLQDVIDYHYNTLISVNKICDLNKDEYIEITSFKTFANLYDAIIFEKNIIIRLKKIIINYSKIKQAITISKKNIYQQAKIYLGLFLAIITKKGFKLITS